MRSLLLPGAGQDKPFQILGSRCGMGHHPQSFEGGLPVAALDPQFQTARRRAGNPFLPVCAAFAHAKLSPLGTSPAAKLRDVRLSQPRQTSPLPARQKGEEACLDLVQCVFAGQPFAACAPDCRHRPVAVVHLAGVPTEIIFTKVAVQVLLADRMINSRQAAFD